MKKIVSIILFIILLIVSFNVKAVSESDSTVNMSFTKSVNENNVEITMKLGEFEGVTENSIMTATMTMDYDKEIISKISGESSNNWKITIEETTNRILLETDTAKPNTEVAKITFFINPEVENTTSAIAIKEINIASSTSELDEYYNDQTINFTINEKTPSTPSGDENKIPENTTNNTVNNTTNTPVDSINNATNKTNTTTNNSTENKTNTTIPANKDNTTATNKLPDTGIKNVLIIAIVIVAICIVIFKIKSRKIKY